MKSKILLPLLAAVGLALLVSAAYTVAESELVILTQFGQPVGAPVRAAGLHWKVPFFQEVHRFEKRLLDFNGEATEIPTRDKKFIFIDTFARWRIADPLLFFRSVGDAQVAKTRLDDVIDSKTRDVVSRYALIEAVRNSSRPFLEDKEVGGSGVSNRPSIATGGVPPGPTPPPSSPATQKATKAIEKGREALDKEILLEAAGEVARYGIELVDVRIKAIGYVPQVQERIYERMISERQQVAERYRAEGQREAKVIGGLVERERARILSEAYRETESIKGEADAKAARIFAEVVGEDVEFYAFWSGLQIYRELLPKNAGLVVGGDRKIFRYLLDNRADAAQTGPTLPQQSANR